MASSIDDILAGIARAHAPGQREDDSIERQRDLEQLTHAWVSERVCPEIFPYPTELMDRVMQRIRAQIETIEDTTARMDTGSSFGLVVVQTELERFKYLVRSYLRTRISKIDGHALHYLTTDQASTTPLLSPSETQYAQTHAALLERHYNASFLASFPPKLRRLDDRAGAGGVGMVEGPDVDKAVFVRCIGRRKASTQLNGHRQYDFDNDDENDRVVIDDANLHEQALYEGIEVNCGYADANEPDARSNTRTVRNGQRIAMMKRGEIWLLRWSSVRDAVGMGECELI